MFFKGVTTSNYYQENKDNPNIDLLAHIDEIDNQIQILDKDILAPLLWMGAEVVRFMTIRDDKREYHRHKFYPQYKANRCTKTITPASILNDKTQDVINKLKEIYKHRNVLYTPGIEADDLVGSGLTEAHPIVLGQDKDLKTLPNVTFYDTLKGTYYAITEMDAIHFTQFQMVTGDSSDGYPGIPGIGPAKFNSEFGDTALPWDEFISIYVKLCKDNKKDVNCREYPYQYMALMYKLAHILHPGELIGNTIKYKYPFNYTDNDGAPMEK